MKLALHIGVVVALLSGGFLASPCAYAQDAGDSVSPQPSQAPSPPDAALMQATRKCAEAKGVNMTASANYTPGIFSKPQEDIISACQAQAVQDRQKEEHDRQAMNNCAKQFMPQTDPETGETLPSSVLDPKAAIIQCLANNGIKSR